ncbi:MULTISPECIES: hypothetical protein [unclassified Pseudovibrio]|uniref:hypothetical protein n=1 Tax=unclassified Pseudovibrio TaxID=2627060 RepID=UPI0007AE3BDD|nr:MULTISPECIES: hypothetical protein [unclassified Pseudovibrio]KZL02811.1 hypothetical protein PsW74_01005 [Pseudovibrio sp. W74]KZL07514.1 hypothetical protein PsAD14_03900 [Pseudovibrio sp. Ad14]
MPSAQVIQFPATKQSPAQTPTKSVQDVGEDALARTGEAHGDICIFRSDLRLMLNQAPNDRKQISARILALRETFKEAELQLVKLLQEIRTATPADAV